MANHVEYTSSDDDECDDTPYFLRNCLLSDGPVKLYSCTARDFVPHVKTWANNRPLNEAHVKRLAARLKNSTRVMDTFKIIIAPDGTIRGIDGKHRVSALHQIMREDVRYDIPILIEAYSMTDDDGDLFC